MRGHSQLIAGRYGQRVSNPRRFFARFSGIRGNHILVSVKSRCSAPKKLPVPTRQLLDAENMRSQKLELRVAHLISEAADRRSEEEGYRNCKRYIIGLIVEDIVYPKKHCTLAHTIGNADPKLQDELIDKFLFTTRDERSRRMIQLVKKEVKG